MKNFQNKKKLQIVLLVLIAVLTLGIGYASITAVNLIINICYKNSKYRVFVL